MKGITNRTIVHETFRSFLLVARKHKKKNVQIFYNPTGQKIWFFTEQTTHSWKAEWQDVFTRCISTLIKEGFILI